MNNKEINKILARECKMEIVAGYITWIPKLSKLGIINTTKEILYFTYSLKFHNNIQIINIANNFSKIIPIESILHLQFRLIQ